jgi:succinoglycan biosynthesis protein ExoV
MKLYYCKYPDNRQNFGDALNPWLWEQLLPGILDDDPSSAFVGIGTLINDALPRRTPNAKYRAIFSSGVGYGKALPSIDNSYKIYCLRGPISAKILGVSPDLAVADGALLLNKLIDLNPVPKQYKFSYMPHYDFAGDGWEQVCKKLGFGYISPSWKIEDILISIRQTEVLVSEAMHGAIVADALRIPWISVKTHPSILALKWQDYCASMELKHTFYSLSYLHQPRSSAGGWAKPKTSNSLSDFLLAQPRKLRDWLRQDKAAQELSNLTRIAEPCLSSDERSREMLSRLESCLDRFKLDFSQGKFKS